MAETSINPYLRCERAAAYLGVSPRTLEKWRRQGHGPRYVRLGSRLVAYLQRDLDAWATRQSIAGDAA